MGLRFRFDEHSCLNCQEHTACMCVCNTCNYDFCRRCAEPCKRHFSTLNMDDIWNIRCPNVHCAQKCSACNVALCAKCLAEQSPLYGQVFICYGCVRLCARCDRAFARRSEGADSTICSECL